MVFLNVPNKVNKMAPFGFRRKVYINSSSINFIIWAIDLIERLPELNRALSRFAFEQFAERLRMFKA